MIVLMSVLLAACAGGSPAATPTSAVPTATTTLPSGATTDTPAPDVAAATEVLSTQEDSPEPTSTPTAEPAVEDVPTQPSAPAPTRTAGEGAASQPLPAGPLTIVALGDSLTEGDGDGFGDGGGYPIRLGPMVSDRRPGSEITNFGKSGWTSDQLVAEQLPAALELAPHIAIVWIGSNDLWYNNGSEEEEADLAHYTANIDAILSALSGAGAHTFIALLDDQTLRPYAQSPDGFGLDADSLERMSRRARAYNEAISAKAAEYGAVTVDFFDTTIFTDPATLADDGIHPNPAGYDIITQMWFDAISPQL